MRSIDFRQQFLGDYSESNPKFSGMIYFDFVSFPRREKTGATKSRETFAAAVNISDCVISPFKIAGAYFTTFATARFIR